MTNPYAMQDALRDEDEARGEAFTAWCEANGYDAFADDDAPARDAYVAWCEEQDDARY